MRLSNSGEDRLDLRREEKRVAVVPLHERLNADAVAAQDERLLPLQAADLQRIPDTFFRRYPSLHGKPCWFFFDEIQNIPGWERFVRRLLDAGFIRLCVTGSSSRLLSREIATSLRGRSLATEVFPFSFAESLDHQGIGIEEGRLPGARKRALLANRFRTYLEEGGFPEVQGLEAEHRIRILQDYLDVVILRDVVERHQATGTAALRYMIRHLINAAGTLFSVHKFYNDIKSQGIAVSKNTLHDYLQHLADAFLFFPVSLHTGSERARMVNPRKVYAIDTGLVRACSRSASRSPSSGSPPSGRASCSRPSHSAPRTSWGSAPWSASSAAVWS